jgi:hypothetical protein
MKILDLKNSFVRAIISKKVEKVIKNKFGANTSILLADLSAEEENDILAVRVNGVIKISKKDLMNILN